ncbi:MAG: hypothetical protein AAF411_09000 [Myxococcota bacterium]
MNRALNPVGLRALSLLLAVAAYSCGGGGGSMPDDSDVPSVGESLDLTGYVILAAGAEVGERGVRFNLWDPRTNTPSEFAFPAASFDAIAVSPDGRLMAHGTPNEALIITRVITDGGRPSLEQVAAFEDIGRLGSVRFNSFGDRIVTDHHFVDFAEGEVDTCAVALPGQGPSLRLFGSGYDYLCDGARHRDGEVIGPSLTPRDYGAPQIISEPPLPSLDGQLDSAQWASDPLVLNTQATIRPSELAADRFFFSADATLWRAENAFFGTRNGDIAVGCPPVGSDRFPRESESADLLASFAESRWVAERDVWPLGPALQPFTELPEGVDYRVFAPVGRVPSTDEVVYGIESIVRVQNCQETTVGFQTVTIARDGSTRTFDFRPRRGAATPYGVYDYGDGDFLVGTRVGLTGAIGGAPFEGQGILNAAGDALIYREENDGRLCARGVRSGDVRCVELTFGGEPLGFVGEGVFGEVAAPLITGLSHVARPTGSRLIVFGAGFNNAGTLHLGDRAIEARETSFWSDGRIELNVPADVSAQGVVRVESGGRSSGQDGFLRWFARTEPVNTPFDGFPRDLIFRQGLNRFALSEGLEAVDGRERDADGLFTYFEEGVDENERRTRVFQADAFTAAALVDYATGEAPASSWRPVHVVINLDINPYGFGRLAGELVNFDEGERIDVRERVRVLNIQGSPRGATNPFGAPRHVRIAPAGSLTVDLRFNFIPALITGFAADGGAPTFEDVVLSGTQDFGVAGNFVLGVGGDYRFGAIPEGYSISTNGGASFGDLIEVGPVFFNPIGFVFEGQEAVWVTDAGDFEYVVREDGVTPLETQIDRALLPALGRDANVYVDGARALTHVPLRGTMATLRVEGGRPVVEAFESVENVVSVTHEPDGGLLIVDAAGVVRTATVSAPEILEVLPLNVTFDDGTDADVKAAAWLDDGRLLVRARLTSDVGWYGGREVLAVSAAAQR